MAMQSHKFFAVRFNVDSNQTIQSYSLVGYNNFLTDVKNQGHKVHLTGYKLATDAEDFAMRQVGLPLEEVVKKNDDPEAVALAAEAEESEEATTETASSAIVQ